MALQPALALRAASSAERDFASWRFRAGAVRCWGQAWGIMPLQALICTALGLFKLSNLRCARCFSDPLPCEGVGGKSKGLIDIP